MLLHGQIGLKRKKTPEPDDKPPQEARNLQLSVLKNHDYFAVAFPLLSVRKFVKLIQHRNKIELIFDLIKIPKTNPKKIEKSLDD